MISTKTDSELGPELMTIRGFQWIYGIKNDPYALLLRAESDDPHELGRRARERGALTWSSAETWVTAQHELAAGILSDPRLGVNYPELDDSPDEQASYAWQIPLLNDVLPLGDAFLTMDRADYERLRGLAESAIGGSFQSDVAKICHQELDRLDGEFDLMAGFAHPCAVAAVGTLLGLPSADHERFTRLCAGAAPALDATLCPPRLATARELITAVSEIRMLVTTLIESRRQAPGDDLLSGILQASNDEEQASHDALAVGVLLAVAGVEVNANLTCKAMSALLDYPDQWALLGQDPDLVANAVQEALRYAPPVRLGKLVAHEDVELAGQSVKAGSEVVVLIEAANRDPDAFADPDRFDIRRETRVPQLSFYGGLYTSVLAPLTLPHATAAVAAIASRLPGIRRTDAELRRLRSPVTGGLLCLPVATK